MLQASPHLQRALDETFPGLKLEFNERTGYWVLVDDLYFVDGSVNLDVAYPPPGGLVGLEPYPLTRRAIIWMLGDPSTGERWEPHADLILNALYHAYSGARIDAIEEHLDRIEESEAKQEELDRAPMREAAREKAGEIFDRVVRGRSTFSDAGTSTPWKTERALAEKARAQEEDTVDADAEAAALIKSGQYAHAGHFIRGGK